MQDDFNKLGGKTEIQSDADDISLNNDMVSISSGFGSIGGSFKIGKGMGVPSHKVSSYKGRRATNMKVSTKPMQVEVQDQIKEATENEEAMTP